MSKTYKLSKTQFSKKYFSSKCMLYAVAQVVYETNYQLTHCSEIRVEGKI